MGIHPLVPARISERTAFHDRELELKRVVESDPRRTVFAELDSSRDAQEEVLALLATERPDVQPVTGEAAPLLALGRCIQEDLILLREDAAGAMRVIAGSLFFPSVWSIREKLGKEFLDVHSPVKGFADSEIGRRSAQFLTRMQPGKPVWRSNWTLQASDRLDTSPENAADWIGMRNEVTEENCATFVHLRLELQKLIRLPTSNAILFSIHTLVEPLRNVARAQPEAANLLGAMETLNPEIAAYKGMTGFLPIAIRVLEKAISENQ